MPPVYCLDALYDFQQDAFTPMVFPLDLQAHKLHSGS